MGGIKIDKGSALYVTPIPNELIDNYFISANGEYVKVFLCLLSMVTNSKEVGVSGIADKLMCTEGEVMRALTYWEDVGILNMQKDSSQHIVDISPDIQPAYHKGSNENNHQKKENSDDIDAVIEEIEAAFDGKATANDVDTILYLHDQLDISHELIKYTILHCKKRGKQSARYVEQTLMNWHRKGVKTVGQAQLENNPHRLYYEVMNELGINNHVPTTEEISTFSKWIANSSLEVVLEACKRTMAAIHKPSIPYTDKILATWLKKGVKTVADISAADLAYEEIRKKNS